MLQMVPGQLVVRWKKQEVDPDLMPSINISSGRNTDLNVKDKTLSCLEENSLTQGDQEYL